MKRRSLQDRIRGRQEGRFVGRESQVVQFRENLALPLEDERRRFIFNIHGVAGVGKTYLANQLRQIASDNGYLTAHVDESVDGATSAMTAIAEEFSRQGARLREFEKRVAVYRRRRHELESDPNAPEGVAAFLTKMAVVIGIHAARGVPIAGSVLAPVDAAALGDQADRARSYLVRKFKDREELSLLLSPAELLTPVFVTGLMQVAANRPIALFFDTYERTASLLERWLLYLYAGRYGDLPETLIAVISGQYPLSPNRWGDYLGIIADVPLEPFSEVLARQFLASKNITDEPTIEVILTLSGRLPLWLATLADARPYDKADIGDPVGEAVERFLRWENDPGRRVAAIIGALPRTFNQDVLAIITPDDKDVRELFSWLCGLSFVSQRSGSWRYHDVVRFPMLRLQRAQSPSQWRANHVTLAQAYAKWATEAAGDSVEAWANEDWVENTCERTYHLLCADPVGNLVPALAAAVKAQENGIAHARRWAELLADAGRDTDNSTLLQWGQRLRHGIKESDSIEYITELINEAALDDNTLALAFRQRAMEYLDADHFDDAQADFNQALELNSTDSLALSGRGLAQFMMDQYDEALGDFNRALELGVDPTDESAVVAVCGQVYQAMERYDEALTDFNRALDLDPDLAWAVASRGQVYRDMERYDEALTDFNRAVDLGPDVGWVIRGRGQVYRDMERYDEALTDFNRALDLDPDLAWVIGSRGQVYQAMERYDEALTYYNRALDLDPDLGWVIRGRGQVYRDMERYEEALADFNRAVDLDPDLGWVIGGRGEIYRLMERYDEALTDFNRALDLNPDLAWVIGSRGQVYQAMERYDEALTDFNRALDLDPDLAWVVASRGQVYQAVERH
jgi:tetratricopeptide (TPR) repeat protein